MKRKTLISITLLLIMLLNCILPLFVVNAAADGEEISLNSKLYAAVKSSLQDQGISFQANNVTHTLTISTEELSKVTELNLNEGGIYDLTGLEKFTSVKHLELSGNNLSKNSNLEVLNGLPLNYLDLSTNSLEDVSAIDGLIGTINDNKGTVILSGQTVTIVENAIIDVEEESNNEITATFSLPSILEKAGFLKSVWMKQYGISENGVDLYPKLEELSNPVNAENNFYKIRISSDRGDPCKGLYKLEIYIYDDPTEAASAANLNPAATNILNGSRFYLYVVVHDTESTAITTPDTNLYKAIKEQLTAGQTINPNLASYPYNVDANSEIVYDECTYQVGDNGGHFLTVIGEDMPTYLVDGEDVYIIDYENNMNGIYGGSVTIYGETYSIYYYDTKIEKTIISTTDDFGVIQYREGYKVANKGENRTLYIRAYDEAKTFVIDNDDLYNKITNLILNNKEIRDLTGIEHFVGLDSYLNVSHNYLNNIEPIYDLQANKDAKQAELQAKFTKYLTGNNSLGATLEDTRNNKNLADSQIKLIGETVKTIMSKFKEASEIKEYTEKEVEKTTTDPVTGEEKKEIVVEKTKNENYKKDLEGKAKEIDNLIKLIYGYNEVEEMTGKVKHIDGYLELLDRYLGNTTMYSKQLYDDLSRLYSVYNKDYKLATILTPGLNYQDLEEYLQYKDALMGTSESVKNMYIEELTRIAGYYDQDALTQVEKDLIFEAIGISDSSDEDKNPITEYIGEYLSKEVGNRVYWADRIEEIRQAALYIEMINYCMIHRMEDPTATVQCYVEEYLMNRIKDFEYEGINLNFEKTILATLKGEDVYTDNLYDIFVNFMNSKFVYTDSNDNTEEVNTCQGKFEKFNNILEENTTYTDINEIAARAGVDADNAAVAEVYSLLLDKRIIKTIKVFETIDDNDEFKGNLNLYEAITSLSGKFIANASEVSRYITLPKLKKLDISYNAYLEGIERISELTGLRELYANADYITDISEVDWSAMKYLRKLGLAYNYIPSIEALEVLENAVEIDASHNLIAGEFKFNFTKLQYKLMKLDLSYNQITDITSIMQWLDMWSGGNDGNYLAREDTIDINLQNQSLELEIKDPIWLNEYPETVDIELPKIFTQLAAIDVNRTAFGETSQNGRIESEGKFVTLNTRTVGEKEGVVKVLAMSGDGSKVDTCVGEGTTVKIKYAVDEKVVAKVNVVPSEATVKVGDEKQFTATVEGTNVEDTGVVWTIEGNTSEGTTISEDGILTVAEDEEAEEITVIATSIFDNTKSDNAVVKIVKEIVPEGTTVTISPENATVKVGNTKQFIAEVEGEVEDKTIVWTIEGNTSENTNISEEGILTVAEDEEAEEMTITATLNVDTSKTATATVKVAKADEIVPEVTSVKVNEATTDVKPGDNKTFTATVEGENLTDTSVTWKIEGNTSEETTISNDGVLTIGADEAAETIKVIAISNYDTSKTAIVTLNVIKEESTEEIKLGYETKDDFIIGIKPKTPVADFQKILIGEQEYNVVIKKDGNTITDGYMKTGMFIQIQDKDGNVIKDTNGDLVVYEAVVTGDVNGDGVANSLDSALIKAHRTDVKVLQGSAFAAADINKDGNVNVSDSKLLLYHRAEVAGYDLNYKK